MFQRFTRLAAACHMAVLALFVPCLAISAEPLTQNVVQTYSGPAYADLADLADSAPLVILGEIRGMIRLEGARAANAPDGFARVYVEARGLEALRGVMPEGQELRYLADVPVDAKGRVASFKKAKVVLFARPVAGGNGEIQLISGDAQLAAVPEILQRLRPLLAELTAAGAPPRITGVSMALYQEGNLAGEGETQIFLNTASGTPAAIIVQHKTGQPPRWSLSFSEVVDPAGRPPVAETLPWYRLACFLPASLPTAANVGDSQEAKDRAMGDYLLVRRDVGVCERRRGR
jgi:hypothetical protein